MTFSMIQYPNRTRADTQIMRLRCRGEDGSYIVTSAFTTWWLNADGHNHVEDLKSWLQYRGTAAVSMSIFTPVRSEVAALQHRVSQPDHIPVVVGERVPARVGELVEDEALLRVGEGAAPVQLKGGGRGEMSVGSDASGSRPGRVAFIRASLPDEHACPLAACIEAWPRPRTNPSQILPRSLPDLTQIHQGWMLSLDMTKPDRIMLRMTARLP